MRHLWGTMPEARGEPSEVSAGSSTRPRPGQARGHGRVKHEATAGSSTRPWQLRRSLPGLLRGGCEGASWEAFRAGSIPAHYNRQAPPTGDYSRRAALCEDGRRGLGQEASVGRRRSGGVADPASDSCGASWLQLVEPCDQLRHVAPWSLVPRGHALREARPPTLHP